MISNYKFPITFDSSRLFEEAAGFSQSEWIPHFNRFNYEGDWSGVALRAAANSHIQLQLYPDPHAESYEDTENLIRCPYTREVIDAFKCEKESARFLKLGAGARIKLHRDYKLAFEDGIARIHIPVKTSKLVEFYLEDNRLTLNEGETWYINFNLQHRVTNAGTEDRIHLVIDLVVNDWLREFIGHGGITDERSAVVLTPSS